MSDVQAEIIPFGNPDGSREQLDQIVKTFVSFGNASAWGGLSTPADDRTARILVGRKGSGKTLYLRRLHAHASTENSVYADPIQQDRISTSNVISFCQWFKKNEVDEKWTALWRRAIIRSLISHLLCNENLKGSASDLLRQQLERDFPRAVRSFRAAVSVYSQAASIIYECTTRAQLERYLGDPIWYEIETILADALKDFPPICFYLDAVDEEFENAPLYWLHCQKGLFYQCMGLLRDAKFGSRLHVIICIRDIVLSSVYRSEHQTRYKGESHIRVLNWNKSSISYFLDQKILKLSDIFLVFPGESNTPIESWLGIRTIRNVARDITERLDDYFLRHTRLLPRDIVVLGNMLCQMISRAKATGRPYDLEDIIRNTVSDCALGFGNEQLEICANEFISSSMPHHAAHHGYHDAYVANQDYAKGVVGQFDKMIGDIGIDRFTRSHIEASRKTSAPLFVENNDPWSILWRNRLVGYLEEKGDGERHIFYSDDRIDQFHLPENKQIYLFHPILIDAVGIASVGATPVVPFKNGDV
jgi:hypothetical protein